jgi:hypothetical protein
MSQAPSGEGVAPEGADSDRATPTIDTGDERTQTGSVVRFRAELSELPPLDLSEHAHGEACHQPLLPTPACRVFAGLLARDGQSSGGAHSGRAQPFRTASGEAAGRARDIGP